MSKIGHVAIIMDGNGRWANARFKNRTWGHVRGVKSVSRIVNEASDLGLRTLTLYSFSTENWSRPKAEVTALFAILKKYIIKERENILRNNIVFKILGDVTALPTSTKELISSLENDSKDNNGLNLVFAFNYGSRTEIVQNLNSFMIENPNRELDEDSFNNYMSKSGVEDVDLLIRTGGDQRISNFLLWQLAYAELYFSDTKWPDYTREEFRNTILEVSKRDRRFGMVSATKDLDSSKVQAVLNKQEFQPDEIGS